jgi:3'(2'), 5'-bisphosphate nucleotidase
LYHYNAEGEREAVTSLFGVAVDGTPVAGIIGQPFHGLGRVPEAELGRTVWGGRGVGVVGLGEVEYTPERPRVDATNPDPPVVCVNRITRENRQEAVMVGLYTQSLKAPGFNP